MRSDFNSYTRTRAKLARSFTISIDEIVVGTITWIFHCKYLHKDPSAWPPRPLTPPPPLPLKPPVFSYNTTEKYPMRTNGTIVNLQ